jgi:hypothetical protein
VPQSNFSATKSIIRATTDDGYEMGEVEFEVIKPKVKHTGVSVITENIETNLEFSVVDPRDESIIFDEEVFIQEFEEVDIFRNYATYEYVKDKELDDDKENVWSGSVIVTEVDYGQASEDENEVEVSPTMVSNSDEREIPSQNEIRLDKIKVVKPKLEVNPERAIIGSNNSFTLTYLDGEGNPLEGYSIMVDGEEIGETDENGQLNYVTNLISSTSLKFEAETDGKDSESEDIFTEVVVLSVADVKGPEVETIVDGKIALITISDETKIQKAAINGDLLDMFAFMSEVSKKIVLNSGVNTFNVQAVDVNNNYTETILELKPEVFEFVTGEECEYGTPIMVDGTTMMPIGFVKIFGAEVDFDGEVATITGEDRDIFIELTEGNFNARVNEKDIQLSVAPYLSDKGLIIPLRDISELLGYEVDYTDSESLIEITK